MESRQYICIDLKSFYASVECVDRGLDPLKTNLVVADTSRTEKTICLAVSPSLKEYGISGRARLFETIQRVKEVNADRRAKISGRQFAGKSCDAVVLNEHPDYEVDFIAAPPRMAKYRECSARIYDIYLKFVAKEDIHVYSVDEVFMDVTHYLKLYSMSAHDLAKKIIRRILEDTGITATAGIGTNMYLAKVAMDIVAKHIDADEDGVRIATLDEMRYRQILWGHRPITDFWRVGKGYARKLEANGLYTMGDIARCSVGGANDFYNEELLFKLFGVNAELLIDHAWGYEPCTIDYIKSYVPENNSLSSGQVLSQPYDYDKARIVIYEMTDFLVLDMVDKNVVADQMVLTIGYDIENLTDARRRREYKGEVTIDRYGRRIPKSSHGSINIGEYTSSTMLITQAVLKLFDEIVDRRLLVRRMYVVANHVVRAGTAGLVEKTGERYEQLDLFTDYEEKERKERERREELEREKKLQHAMLDIKKKYGKNAVLRGMNLQEGATGMQRNDQIGGHKA